MIHLIIGCGICVIFNFGLYIKVIKPMDSMLIYSGKKKIKLLSVKRNKHKLTFVQQETFLITFVCTLIMVIIIIGCLSAQLTVWFLYNDGREIEISTDITLAVTGVNCFFGFCLYDKFSKKQNVWLLARHEEETKQEISDDQTDQ